MQDEADDGAGSGDEDGTAEEDRPRDFVASLVHGLNVLKAFSSEHPSMSLSQVAELTAMSRAGARRYLLTLEHLGYLARTGRAFRPTARVLELGYTYLSSVPLADLVQPMLEEVSRATGQTTTFAIRDGTESVYLARAIAPRSLAVSVPVGRRLPLVSTSTGRAMLAFARPVEIDQMIKQIKPVKLTGLTNLDPAALRQELALVRDRGYALVEQEVEVGVRSLAVPVFDKNGKIAAAVAVLTSMSALTADRLIGDVLPEVQKIAEQVRTALKAGVNFS